MRSLGATESMNESKPLHGLHTSSTIAYISNGCKSNKLCAKNHIPGMEATSQEDLVIVCFYFIGLIHCSETIVCNGACNVIFPRLVFMTSQIMSDMSSRHCPVMTVVVERGVGSYSFHCLQ